MSMKLTNHLILSSGYFHLRYCVGLSSSPCLSSSAASLSIITCPWILILATCGGLTCFDMLATQRGNVRKLRETDAAQCRHCLALCPVGNLHCQFDGRLPTRGRPQMGMIAIGEDGLSLQGWEVVVNFDLFHEEAGIGMLSGRKYQIGSFVRYSNNATQYPGWCKILGTNKIYLQNIHVYLAALP